MSLWEHVEAYEYRDSVPTLLEVPGQPGYYQLRQPATEIRSRTSSSRWIYVSSVQLQLQAQLPGGRVGLRYGARWQHYAASRGEIGGYVTFLHADYSNVVSAPATLFFCLTPRLRTELQYDNYWIIRKAYPSPFGYEAEGKQVLFSLTYMLNPLRKR